MPIAKWLRGELREWAEGLLEPARLRSEGHFIAPVVARRWRQHLQGEADWSSHLWTVLMFQAWYEESSHHARPARVERPRPPATAEAGITA